MAEHGHPGPEQERGHRDPQRGHPTPEPDPRGPREQPEQPDERVVVALDRRQRRLLDVALIFAVIALFFIVAGDLSTAFFQFGDLVLTFFLAWLLAFVLNPLIGRLVQFVPGLPRALAVVVAYLVLLGIVGIVLVGLAASLAQSISDLVAQLPTIQGRLPQIVAPIQERLTALGLQVNVVSEATKLIDNLGVYATELIGPLQSIAVASLGILGTGLIVVILSIYIALDSSQIRAFAYRVVPPSYHDEWALFEKSVGAAFGGFLRGQVVMGLVYAAIALVTSLTLGLEFVPVTTATSGVLQAIPFFGPFLSWAPPVLVAIFTKPEAILPSIVVMGVGWFVVMNILQPRLMNATVGLHPIVVLASVLIGSKVAGVAGAIFGIPVAAVLSAIFIYYFRIFRGEGTVAQRAAARLEAREGHPIRVPREPVAGQDQDVALRGRQAHPAHPTDPTDATGQTRAELRPTSTMSTNPTHPTTPTTTAQPANPPTPKPRPADEGT